MLLQPMTSESLALFQTSVRRLAYDSVLSKRVSGKILSPSWEFDTSFLLLCLGLSVCLGHAVCGSAAAAAAFQIPMRRWQKGSIQTFPPFRLC